MSSTVESAIEMSTEFQTASHYAETTTPLSEGRNPIISVDASSLLPFHILVVILAVLGMFANAFVLGSFRFISRAKMTSAMMYIANQTTLEIGGNRSPFS